MDTDHITHTLTGREVLWSVSEEDNGDELDDTVPVDSGGRVCQFECAQVSLGFERLVRVDSIHDHSIEVDILSYTHL